MNGNNTLSSNIMTTIATQDTDYSSEEDSVFLTQRTHAKRPKITRLSHANKCSTGPDRTTDVRELKEQTTKDLVEWASRLELESITLKETIQEDFVSLVKQHHSDTVRSVHELEKRVDHMAAKLDKSETRIGAKVRDVLESQVGPIEDEQTLINTKIALMNQQLAQMGKTIDNMGREIEEKCKHIGGTLSYIDSRATKVPDTKKDLEEIKEYLRLLLPRIIGIEQNCAIIPQLTKLSDEDPSKKRRFL
ncbi:uncharacterized protein CANTADRAFT_271766 [Suhomyces tanzawaensis NRRL Y-17324]|uniref:Uncharacterized protein n=1 Tax=Suhomyces tanzawaensis NRRL Y-17324 TaxID=984487 RepID=A0A1E4SGV3_9ASCO|nr:uncharacterized protein CANTADRAFT_271766 [Suhomyces tanzawaensis NRRL Y-17324]ODV78642.1 hypothetical protein CANTADRAFT_271766 [Suhomyces tanzawaensis NRRL Y-17324]